MFITAHCVSVRPGALENNRQVKCSGHHPQPLQVPSAWDENLRDISENKVAAGSSASAMGDPNADGKGLSEGHSCPSYRAALQNPGGGVALR